ncbi:MAG: phage holin family protein [Christensenellales bacterium]|jgi:hypothetical protein
MDILAYIVDGALILIPVLLVIGQIIKSIPGIPNWVIPIALLVPGVIGAGALGGWTVESIIQGVLVTGRQCTGTRFISR